MALSKKDPSPKARKKANQEKVESFGSTDVGRGRVSNEDTFFVDLHKRFFIVAHGMGCTVVIGFIALAATYGPCAVNVRSTS